MGKEEDKIEFLTNYKGLACQEVMSTIYEFDWQSLHVWSDYDNTLSDVLQKLYEGFLSGHNVERLANEIVLVAKEVLSEN